jgi:hypothetical protein
VNNLLKTNIELKVAEENLKKDLRGINNFFLIFEIG